MPVIKLNNREVHIQELNKEGRETVVLIHGMFSNLSVYYFNIAPILAEYYHVVMYDLKSHGLSEKVPNGYDLESMTDDLLLLLNALELPQVHLAGYSFGGLIALKMACRFPEMIKKLVVIEAPDPNDDRTRDIIESYNKEFLENYVTNFTDTTKVKMGKRQLERNHRMYEYLFHETSIKTDMVLESDFFLDKGIGEVPHHTLLLYGENSNCVNAGRNLRKIIGRSRLLELSGDHNIPIQEPETVGKMMEMFFKK